VSTDVVGGDHSPVLANRTSALDRSSLLWRNRMDSGWSSGEQRPAEGQRRATIPVCQETEAPDFHKPARQQMQEMAVSENEREVILLRIPAGRAADRQTTRIVLSSIG
jgi:hypothetical protein